MAKLNPIVYEYAADPRYRIASRGPSSWVITDGSEVLNRLGDWEYEPMPSSRTDEFLARTRFASPEEALAWLVNLPTISSLRLTEITSPTAKRQKNK